MNNYKHKIINFIKFLYKNNLQKKWFTMHGTSIYMYTQQINLLKENFKFGDILSKNNLLDKINSILNQNTKSIKENIGPRNSQRLTYWEYLNIFQKTNKNTYKYIYNPNINYLGMSYFIDRGIYLIHKISQPSPLKSIFNGFAIYLIYKTIGVKQFYNIIMDIHDDAANKILKALQVKKSGDRQIDNSTYHDLYINYFSTFNTNDLLKFIDNVINQEYNSIYHSNNDDDDDFPNTILDILNKENLKTYDSSLEKMIINIRNKFSNNLQNHNDDILIDNISNYNLTLFEKAHIFPIFKIKNEIEKYKKGLITIEQLEKLLNLTCNENNGIKIPFNYHKLFDKNLIEIDWINGKFVFSSNLDDNTKQNLIKVFGFNINNKFNEKRFQKIKKNYENILKLIGDF